jgi:hypothetical protein
MNLKLFKLSVVVFVLVLSACAVIIPKEHLISKDQLTKTMQKQFPLHREKGVFSISIDEPQLNLKSGQNRLGMASHFTVHATMLEIEGDFAFSSKLHYDRDQRAVFLQGVSLDSFYLKQGKNIPEIFRSEIGKILNEYAAKNPVYRFKTDELVMFGVKVEVVDITVVPNGILLELRTLH